MTTPATKAITRLVGAVMIEGRPLVLGITPHGTFTVRLKGTRKTIEAPATWVFEAWGRIERRAARTERKRARAAEREARIALQASTSTEARRWAA